MILYRHIALQILKYSLFVVFTLTFFFSLLKFIEEMNIIGKADYDFVSALVFILISMPLIFFSMSSISILMGSILAIAQMNSSKELIIFQASSISIRKIISLSLLSAFLINIIIFIAAEFTGSFFDHASKNYRSIKLNEPISNGDKNIYWFKRDNFFMKIYEFNSDLKTGNLLMYEVDNSNTKFSSISRSEKSILLDEGQKLEKFSRIKFSDKMNLNRILIDEKSYQTNINISDLKALNPGDVFLDVISIIKRIFSLNSSGIDTKKYQLVILERLSEPFLMLIMLFVSAPLILTFDRNISISNRISIGIFMGLLAQYLTKITSALFLNFDFDIFSSVLIPILFVLIFAVFSYNKFMKENYV